MLSNLKIRFYLMDIGISLKYEKYDDALEYCDKVLSLDDNNEKALYKKAYILYKKDMYEETIPLLNKIINNHPHEESYLLLGRIYLLKGNYERGIYYYKLSLDEEIFNFYQYNEELLFFGGDWKLRYISKDYKQFSKYSLDLCDLLIDKYDMIQIKIWKAYKLYALNLYEQSLELIDEILNLIDNDSDIVDSVEDICSVYYLKS